MKKTEEELIDEIVEEYGFEEDDARIDQILVLKKDRYSATQAKRKAQEEAENYKKGKDFYKSKLDPKKGKETKDTDKAQEATLSVKDSARLQEAKVPVSDWDDVIDYAKFKGISIAEAMKSSVVTSTLSGKAEERKTAEATSTGKNKRGADKLSGTRALEKAESSGKMPETDAEIDALLDARLERKAKQA